MRPLKRQGLSSLMSCTATREICQRYKLRKILDEKVKHMYNNRNEINNYVTFRNQKVKIGAIIR